MPAEPIPVVAIWVAQGAFEAAQSTRDAVLPELDRLGHREAVLGHQDQEQASRLGNIESFLREENPQKLWPIIHKLEKEMDQAGVVADGLSNIAAAHDASLIEMRRDVAHALQKCETRQMATEQVQVQMSAHCAEKDTQLADMHTKLGELQRKFLILDKQNQELRQQGLLVNAQMQSLTGVVEAVTKQAECLSGIAPPSL